MTSRLEAFHVRKYVTRDGEEKSAWTRIGVAFPHKNGNGFNVSLECLPAPTVKDGKGSYEIVLREPMERDKPSGANQSDDSGDIPF